MNNQPNATNTQLNHQLFDHALDTLRLGIGQFESQEYKGSYVIALAIEHLKLDVNLEVLDEIRGHLAEFKDEGGVFFNG
jgi:hypothetical protein